MLSTRRARLAVLLTFLGTGLAGACDDVAPLAGGELVDVPPPATRPGGRVAGQYWVELQPKRGAAAIFPIHEGSVIHRLDRLSAALRYDYTTAPCDGEGCSGAAGRVDLFTEPTLVSYVEDNDGVDDGNPADDTCYANGEVFANDATCGGLYQPGNDCTRHGVFCAPIQMTSHATFGQAVGALPDAVLDLGNSSAQTGLLGCRPNTTAGGTGGLCSTDAPARIDPATSNLVPAIDPPPGLSSCAYCYGNRAVATATGRPALAGAVVSGASAAKAAINTNTVAMQLASGADLTIVFTLYYAEPSVEVPGAQLEYRNRDGERTSCYSAREGTTLRVLGAGFGPPADCLADDLPGSCPEVGRAAPGHVVELPGATAPGATSWSDTEVASLPAPDGFYAACPVTVRTPVGRVSTDDEVVACPDQYRRFAPAGFPGRTRFASGVVGDQLLLAGGLPGATGGEGTDAIAVMPLPRCGDPSPAITTLEQRLPAGVGRHSQAATVAAGGLFVIGGAATASTCTNRVVRVDFAPATGASFTPRANLPASLCQATAITLFDQVNGREYIVVTGGTLRPLPRPAGAPAPSSADLAPRASYVYDVAADTWRTFTGATLGVRRYNMAGVGYRAASPADHVGLFAGGASTVTSAGNEPAVATVQGVVLTDGTPFFFAVASLPAPRSGLALALVGDQVYAYGGAALAALGAAATDSLFRIDPRTIASGASWATLSASGGGGRQGHALVMSAFDEPTSTDVARVLAVGGVDTGAPATTALEYMP